MSTWHSQTLVGSLLHDELPGDPTRHLQRGSDMCAVCVCVCPHERRQLQIGVGPSSSPVTATIDSGSGITNFDCLSPSGVANTCQAAPIKGQYYEAASTTLLSSCAQCQFEGERFSSATS